MQGGVCEYDAGQVCVPICLQACKAAGKADPQLHQGPVRGVTDVLGGPDAEAPSVLAARALSKLGVSVSTAHQRDDRPPVGPCARHQGAEHGSAWSSQPPTVGIGLSTSQSIMGPFLFVTSEKLQNVDVVRDHRALQVTWLFSDKETAFRRRLTAELSCFSHVCPFVTYGL